ncbi:MAG: rhodanese-like domain-containing protein [Syntrophobacteraceae bacterium]
MNSKMFLEPIRSEGLAHISYIVGHGGKAAVIDPRRDCAIYLDVAGRYGSAITHIFETHRNEDYVIGSQELSLRTGAAIYHGRAFDFHYGNSLSDGDRFVFGDLALTIVETPGHTYESISLILTDMSFGDSPVAVFSGDTLFIGDVGRTDFFPDRPEEVAGLIYDSIFKKLLPLGDHVILYPGHGAGSVCGKGMAVRDFSTLGYERLNNPVLKFRNRDEFIKFKLSEHHYQPPYFRMMEKLNQEGSASLLSSLPVPRPLNAGEFSVMVDEGALILDIRSPEAFAGAFIPGSLSVPLEMVPAFAGYFLPYGRKIVLVIEHYGDLDTALRYLARLGYDEVAGYLAGGLTEWETSGHTYDTVPAVHVEELVRRIQAREEFTLLDVRTDDEVKQGRLPGAVHTYVGELAENLDALPKDRQVTTFCGSGMRAIIAASILKQNGFKMVEDSLGSMAACMAFGCPIVK